MRNILQVLLNFLVMDTQERKASTLLDSIDLDHHVYKTLKPSEAAGGPPNQDRSLSTANEGYKRQYGDVSRAFSPYVKFHQKLCCPKVISEVYQLLNKNQRKCKSCIMNRLNKSQFSFLERP